MGDTPQSIKGLREQFEKEQIMGPPMPPATGGATKILRKPHRPNVQPHVQISTPTEIQGNRSSLQQVDDKKIVHRRTQMFENGEPLEGKELPKRPVSHFPGKPPLPSKPQSDVKARILSHRTSVADDKDRVPSAQQSPQKLVKEGAKKFEPVSPSRSIHYDDNDDYAVIDDDEDFVDQSESPGKKANQPMKAKDPSELYAIVDIKKKKKYREAVTEDKPGSPGDKRSGLYEQDVDGGGEYALLRVSVTGPNPNATDSKEPVQISPRSPNAPSKPPRTFAHDEYLLQKEMKKHQKKQRKEVDKSRLENVCEYEEVGFEDNTPRYVTKPKYKSSTIHRMPSTEKSNKCDSPLSKRPSDRPPPPPRPPPPNPKMAAIGATDPKRWEKPFVQVLKHNDRLPKESFLPRGKVSNPSYEADWDIIRIRKPQTESKTNIKRCKSDECLYAEPNVNGVRTEPVYSEPFDRIVRHDVAGSGDSSASSSNVMLDSEGYAIPEMDQRQGHGLHRQNTVIGGPPNGSTHEKGQGHYVRKPQHGREVKVRPGVQKRPPVQEKLSRAYSVLRLGPAQRDSVTHDRDDKSDSDNEVDPEEHEKRLIYVSNVKMRLSIAMQQSSRRLPSELSMNLFNYAAIISLERIDDSIRYRTKPAFSFPKQTPEQLAMISQFCFPDLAAWRPVTRYKSETFSFVLTDAEARRQYGYCKRFLPPGSGNRLPVVFCIVSALDAFTFYDKLLSATHDKQKISTDHAEMLLQAAYATRLPKPGQEAWIASMNPKDKKETLFIKRPEDVRLENVSFEPLLTNLSVDNLIKVFASILLERKLVFVAQHLSTLTSCIHALCALLYPFAWPHPFIPVLPESMIEVCGCPTPIMVGVLTTTQPKLAEVEMDEVLMVDLDHNTLMRSQGDEARIIPKKLQKALRLALKEDGDVTSSRDIVVMESFLRFFVETTGHYTEYMCTQMDGEKIFEKKAFITSVSSRSIRMFLEWFTETQMFEMFITDRLENPQNTGLFESRIHDYREEMMTDTTNLRQNMKVVGKKMKDFFIASGDKLKKTFSRNVFI